jgi:hypothetical protein
MRVARYRLRDAGCGLRVSSYGLRIASCELGKLDGARL